MDLWQLSKLLARRWYVVAPIVFVAAVLALAIGGSVQPEYRAEGSIVLVGPSVAAGEGDVVFNPYLALGNSLGSVSQVTGLAATSSAARTEIDAAGLYPDYEIGTDSRSPIIQIAVRGTDSERVVETVDAVIELLQVDLESRQIRAGVSSENRIRSEVLVRPGEPTASLAARTRMRLTVLGVGFAIAVVSVLALEQVGRRRTSVFGRDHAGEPSMSHDADPSSAEEPIASGDAPPAAADVGDSHPHSVVEGHDPEPPAPRFLPLPGLERVSNRSASTEWIYTGSATAQGPWPRSETPTAPAEEQPTVEPGPDEREEALQEEGGDVPQPDPWLRRP